MNKTNNPKLTENAKKLRKSMTKEERHLWYDFLKTIPQTVNRQKVIGSYIADFYCAEAKLVIELDGTQHFENAEKDMVRDRYFKGLGLTVVRYSNRDVWNSFERVCADILQRISTSSTASGPPSPRGEGK